ncbi:MAG: Porin precursor [Planctomycetota bacterium]
MERAILAASAVVVAPLAALVAQENQLDPAREWVGGAPFSQWTRATGDWAGLRPRLEDLGIEVSGGYTSDWSAAFSGDVRRRDSYSSLLDFNAAFDLEHLVGWARTIAFVDFYALQGRDPSDDIGDAQGVSNLQGDDREILAELWVETWLSDQWRLKVGKIDFNSEFAFNELGGEFVNSTAAVPPTIVAYPTYPDPATAVNLFYHHDDSTYVGFGAFDGAGAEGYSTGKKGLLGIVETDDSDAWFLTAEVGTAWTGGGRWGSGRAAIGGWHHTADFAEFAGSTSSGTSGGWLTLEQTFWRENPDRDDDGQGFGAYTMLGYADDAVSAFGNSLALGLTWTGALPNRDDDVIGLGLFRVDLSDEPGAGTPDDETVVELLYKLQLTPSVSLKPELQYVINPGGQSGVDDVVVGLLRVEILF